VKISLEGEDYEPLCVLYMGFTSITIDVPCNGIFNRAHFVKKKKPQTTLSHKTHTSLSRGFFEDCPKGGRKNIWWTVGI